MTELRFVRRRGRRAILALLAGLFVAVSLTMPAAAKTFTWSHKGDAHNMDPYGVAETLTLSVLGNIYEGLVRRGKNLEIEPALAERWEIVGPTRWRFFLRKGVTFHDGSAFTADDVIFSWKRILSKGSDLKYFVSGIKDIKVKDRGSYFSRLHHQVFRATVVTRMITALLGRMTPITLLMIGQIGLILVAIALFTSEASRGEIAAQMAFLVLVMSRLLPSASRVAGTFNKMIAVVPHVNGPWLCTSTIG